MVDDVKQYKIDEIASIKTGDKDTQNAIEDGIFPFYVRSDKIERINTYSFNGEAVLTSGDGVGVGKIFHYINGKFDFHQRVYAIHNFDDQLVDGKFFYYQFSKNFYERVMAMSAKSSVDSVRREMIADMVIKLFPKKEQTAIATALSDMDGLIAATKKLIVKKEAIKQGFMQETFAKRKGWEIKTLLEITDRKKELFDDGDWIESEHITEKGIRIIQTGNIGIGTFIEKGNKKYINKESFQKLGCKEIKEGDLLISRLAEPAGRACVLPNIGEFKMVTSVDVTICRPKPEIANYKFLEIYFSTREWFQKVSERVGGTTHKRISRSSLGYIEILLPDISTQTKIANIFSNVQSELDNLNLKLQKLTLLKQGMMQELLTGRIRLVQTEKAYAVKEESLPMAAEPSNEVCWLDSERLDKEKEAAILAMLVAKSDIALGRFRYQKLMYLFHRKTDNAISGWLNKAAGPYNHDLRYGGVEDFVINQGWCRDISDDKEHPRYQQGTNYNQAKQQYLEHYSRTTLNWLKEYFFFKTDDELEVLATADKAKLSRTRNGLSADWTGVKQYIAQEPEWKDKLKKEHFSDDNLQSAVVQVDGLFEYE